MDLHLSEETATDGERAAVDVILEEIISRSVLYGLPGEAFIVERTENQERDMGKGPQQALQARETVAVGQAQIEQDHRDSVPAESLESVG